MKHIVRLISFCENNQKKCLFVLFAVILIVLNLSQSDKFFYYDSSHIWEVSNQFIAGGDISLFNYSSPRGYLFPLIIYFISLFAAFIRVNNALLYEIVMSLAYSAFLVIIIPEFIRNIYNKTNVRIINIVVFGGFAFLYWRGLFYYPLTDLLSLSFLVTGIFLFWKYQGYPILLIFSGVLIGGTALIRPSYLITIPPLIIVACIYYWELCKNSGKTIAKTAMIIIGIVIVFTPQYLLNKKNFNISSPFVQTQLMFGSDLYVKQLSWGIEIQKYETNVGTSYPSAPVYFHDQQGENILLKEQYKDAPTSVSEVIRSDLIRSFKDYIKLVSKYPLDFICIYLRHLFNGLDVVYNNTYVKDIYGNGNILRLINYTLWYFVITWIVNAIKKLKAFPGLPYYLPIVLALPSILSIPSAMETRFMLPLHFMAYATFAFWIIPEIRAMDNLNIRKTVIHHFLSYCIFVIICFVFSANTFMNIQYGQYTLNSW